MTPRKKKKKETQLVVSFIPGLQPHFLPAEHQQVNHLMVFFKGNAQVHSQNPEGASQPVAAQVPIAPEPYPELDSRPSTASSRDGAQVDPRFEQDWLPKIRLEAG